MSFHPHLYECLQVHVIANTRLVRCVLVRLSLNWPKYERDSGKWKILTRNVATYAAIPIPQRTRATDEELTCPPAWWRNREPCLNQTPHRKTTGLVCLQDIWTLYQYVINWIGQFTVRDLSYWYRASFVDSITDYDGFSPRRSCDVDRVTGCI